MEKQIKEIIELHLPAQTAGVMKEFIERAEDIEDQLNEVIKQHKNCLEIIDRHEETIKKNGNLEVKRRELDDKQVALDSREDLITQRENNAAVIEANLRMEMMETNMKNMEALVGKVFGHPNVQISRTGEIVTGGGVQNQYGGYDGATYAQPTTETETTIEGKS